MSLDQDPTTQIGYLQQGLASGKRPLGFFLGAGCPMAIRAGDGGASPLIPDIAGITARIHDQLGRSGECGRLLTSVEKQLKTDRPEEEATVEDILTHVRALRAVVGRGRVRDLSGEELDQLDDGICQIIYEQVDRTLPSADTPYHRLARWAYATGGDNPVEIFTTNYDLLMEQAFESVRVPYFDGFAGALKPFFDLRAMEEDLLPPRWARIWKLHGSINWYQKPNGDVFRSTPDERDGQKRVIHPSYLKYQQSRRLPYLAMIDRLRAFLKRPAAMLVLCGFSFRDDHINEVIEQGLRGTPTAVAFALLFGGLANYADATKVAHRRPNLNMLARDGCVIGGQESKWLKRDTGSAAPEEDEWVKWLPTEEGKQAAEFNLGDFAAFGELLELVGRTRQMRDGTDAE